MDVRGIGRIYPGELRPTEPPDVWDPWGDYEQDEEENYD